MAFLERNANRGSVPTGFNIENSIKFESGNREYLRWTNFSGNASSARKKKFSMSLWCKRTKIGGQMIIWSTAANGYLSFEADDEIKWFQTYGGSQKKLNTRRVFRDMTAWYHIVVAVDSTQSTEAHRMRLYINGVEETDFVSATYPAQNAEAQNIYEQHLLLGEWGGGASGFNGYVADYLFVSEVQLVPTDVGEYDEDSGIWKPKDYEGTISSPSHFLEFKDGSALGNATSGLSANYLENVAAADQATDTPTNNFAIMNPLIPTYASTPFLYKNGATEIKRDPDDSGGWMTITSTMAVNKGKWYAEFEVLESPSLTMYGYASLALIQGLATPAFYLGTTTASAGYYSNGDGANDAIYHNASDFPTAGVQSAAGTIISVAMDCDNNKIHFANNGTYTNSSNPANNTNGFAMVDDYVYFAHSSYTGNKTYKTNLGGYTTDGISSAASDANGYGTFEYAPPTGYYALCTKNLAEYG